MSCCTPGCDTTECEHLPGCGCSACLSPDSLTQIVDWDPVARGFASPALFTGNYYENGEGLFFQFTIYPGDDLPFASIWWDSDQNWQVEPEIFNQDWEPIYPWTPLELLVPEDLWLRIPPLPQQPPLPIPNPVPPQPLPIPTPQLPFPFDQFGDLVLDRYRRQPALPQGVYPWEPGDTFYPEPDDTNRQGVLIPTDEEPEPWIIRPVFRYMDEASRVTPVDSGTGGAVENIEFKNIHGVQGWYSLRVEKQGTWPAGADVTVPAGCTGPIADEIVRNFDVTFTSAPVVTETLSCLVHIDTHEVAGCIDDAITTDTLVVTFEAAVIAVALTPDPIEIRTVPLSVIPITKDWNLQNNALVPVDFTMTNTPDGGLSGVFVVTPPSGAGLIAGGNQPGTLEYTPLADAIGSYNNGTLQVDAENPANPSETGLDQVDVHVEVAAPLLAPVKGRYIPNGFGGSTPVNSVLNYVSYAGNRWTWSGSFGGEPGGGTRTIALYVYDNGTPSYVAMAIPGFFPGPNAIVSVEFQFSDGYPSGDTGPWNYFGGGHAVRNPVQFIFGPNVY